MICWKIYYEQYYSREKLKPIQTMILHNADFDDIIDACEEHGGDFNYFDEAYIDLAIQLGWNAQEFIDEELEEQANLVLSFDGEVSESLSKLMSNAALEFVNEYLEEHKDYLEIGA